MLKSCNYCGGIHDRTYQCPSKPNRKNKVTHVDKFRRLRVWTNKSKQIKQRDRHLCQICIRELYETQIKYNFTNLEVHHIVPIIEDWDKRLEDMNLITLCSFHHKMAEKGQIGKEELLSIVREQERV